MSKKLSREEIMAGFDKMMPELQKAMANLSGAKVRGTVPEDAKVEFVNLIESLQKFQGIDFSTIDTPEKRQQFAELSSILKGMLGVQGDVDISEVLATHTSSLLEISSKDKYLLKTSFAAYKDSLFKIVEKIFAANKVQNVKNYLSTIPAEDIYSFSQNAARLERQLPFLRKKYSRVTRQVVEKYVSIHRDLSTITEMLIRHLIAVRKILDDEPIEYVKIKNDNLANHISSLSKIPHFSELVAPFNITIRNAMAHGSTALEPMSESIRFTDRRRTVQIKYDDFLNQTRELAATVLVIMNLSTAMNLHALQIARKNRNLS